MKINNFLKLIIAIFICELAGVIGAFFTTPAISGWYASLAKPALSPPNWIFAPVWTILFALMGISAFLIWENDSGRWNKKIALVIFSGQLLLNILWSIIFFGLRNPAAAFIEIIFLWLAIFATIILFAKISKPAAWLLVPYILWVSFAGYLNYSIWQLSANLEKQIPCTMEAKLCPDGSSVGRIGPECEFAACPGVAPLVGGDKDEHGCIGSAGYSWCAAKQKCLRIFEEDCLSAQEIKLALAQKYNKPISEVFLKINKENAKYAAGSVKFGSEQGEGGMFLAAKINEKWELVYDGNGSIDCNKIKQNYQFPPEMLLNFCD